MAPHPRYATRADLDVYGEIRWRLVETRNKVWIFKQPPIQGAYDEYVFWQVPMPAEPELRKTVFEALTGQKLKSGPKRR